MEPEDKDTILPGFEEEILPEASNDPITRNTNNIENEVLPGIGQNSEPEEFYLDLNKMKNQKNSCLDLILKIILDTKKIQI